MQILRNLALLLALVPLKAGTLPGTVVPNSPFTPVILATPTCTPAACDIFEGTLQNLPFVAIAGDVILSDPDGSVSDVVRFFNNLVDTGAGTGLGTQVFMYSKIDTGPERSFGPDLGLPSASTFSANAIRIAEAPDGTPTIYNGNGTIYSFYSDVPEPSTITCVAAGLLALGAKLLRR